MITSLRRSCQVIEQSPETVHPCICTLNVISLGIHFFINKNAVSIRTPLADADIGHHTVPDKVAAKDITVKARIRV